jgi:hypothetical protein
LIGYEQIPLVQGCLPRHGITGVNRSDMDAVACHTSAIANQKNGITNPVERHEVGDDFCSAP